MSELSTTFYVLLKWSFTVIVSLLISFLHFVPHCSERCFCKAPYSNFINFNMLLDHMTAISGLTLPTRSIWVKSRFDHCVLWKHYSARPRQKGEDRPQTEHRKLPTILMALLFSVLAEISPTLPPPEISNFHLFKLHSWEAALWWKMMPIAFSYWLKCLTCKGKHRT